MAPGALDYREDTAANAAAVAPGAVDIREDTGTDSAAVPPDTRRPVRGGLCARPRAERSRDDERDEPAEADADGEAEHLDTAPGGE